jgi:ornithine carbamoyltransferase
MKNLIRLTDWTAADIYAVFQFADEIADGKHGGVLSGQTIVLYFPPTSLLTRVTFERAVYLLGGQTIVLPNDMLDRRDFFCDTVGYLSNWVSALVVRHRDITVLEELARQGKVPVINAMTSENHPCEILSDLFAMSKLRADYRTLNYLFAGVSGNIGNAWREAAEVLGLKLVQSCPPGYEMNGVTVERDIATAVANADIVLTDSLPAAAVETFAPYRITSELMKTARPGALLNPCPMFFRGQEVSADAIDSEYFVGYGFKKRLAEVQGAVLLRSIFVHTFLRGGFVTEQ